MPATASSARSVSSIRLSRVWSRRSSSQRGSARRSSRRFSPTSPRSRAARSLLTVNAVTVSNDLAARDLGLVGENRLELLLADPRCDELRRLHTLLRRLEETERAEDAVAGIDQVVALEPGQLLELRDEGLVDLAGQLDRAILVHTVVTANGRKHVMLLRSSFRTGESERTPCCAQVGATVDEQRAKPRRLQRQPTRSFTIAARWTGRVASHADILHATPSVPLSR